MVVQRHEHVPGIAANHDVLRLRKEPQAIGCEMALDEAAVPLSFDSG
jgi:hypothetical protein